MHYPDVRSHFGLLLSVLGFRIARPPLTGRDGPTLARRRSWPRQKSRISGFSGFEHDEHDVKLAVALALRHPPRKPAPLRRGGNSTVLGACTAAKRQRNSFIGVATVVAQRRAAGCCCRPEPISPVPRRTCHHSFCRHLAGWRSTTDAVSPALPRIS